MGKMQKTYTAKGLGGVGAGVLQEDIGATRVKLGKRRHVVDLH